jgi:L-amino acid N-acyltransferase YncA
VPGVATRVAGDDPVFPDRGGILRIAIVLFGQTLEVLVCNIAAASGLFLAIGGSPQVEPSPRTVAVRAGATLVIREARAEDWPGIRPIIHDVVTEQETFPYDPAMTDDDARRMWLLAPPARVVVATDGDRVTGTANMYANRPGPGSHVASGSLMVAAGARGTGVGRALTTDLVAWARRTGFAAVQFNAVVDVNTAAIRLYESLGFVTLGVAPGAFRHPRLGDVGLRIMWLDLR